MIIGVDPGLSGAMAAYEPCGNALTVTDIPTHTLSINGRDRRRLDGHSLARGVAILSPGAHVYIENVHSMPAQGVASSFSFGFVAGAIQQAFIDHGFAITLVEPALWKRILGVPANKDGARRRASQLMPKHAHLWTRTKDDGRAEATLLAYYGAQIQAATKQLSDARCVLEIFS